MSKETSPAWRCREKEGEKIAQRVAQIGLDGYAPEANPVVFWDLHGGLGHPVRTTISELGPTLLARILDLNAAQVGTLEIAFKLADDRGLLLLDLDDLRALLTFVAENKQRDFRELRAREHAVGGRHSALAALARAGGRYGALWRAGPRARRSAPHRSQRPRHHQHAGRRSADSESRGSTRPSCCGCSRSCSRTFPKSAISTNRSWYSSSTRRICCSTMRQPALRERVEQVVRIIRSKGVGVYFCSQFPDDVPGRNPRTARQPHSARAAGVYAARSESGSDGGRDVRREPEARRRTGDFAARRRRGARLDTPGQWRADAGASARSLRRRAARIGAITADERAAVRLRSPIGAKYDTTVNRESAYEMLKSAAGSSRGTGESVRGGTTGGSRPTAEADESQAGLPRRTPEGTAAGGSAVNDFLWGTKRRQGMVETMAKQAARTVGSQLGRQILRGVLGGIFGGRRR